MRLGSNVDTSAGAILDMGSVTTGAVVPPKVTTTQRDAIASQIDGMVVYNITTSKLQVRAGGLWVDLH